MARLFETTTVKNLQLDNRFVRSATWLGMAAQDGSCTPRLIDAMTELARGGGAPARNPQDHFHADG